jgi:hypothetical protein
VTALPDGGLTVRPTSGKRRHVNDEEPFLRSAIVHVRSQWRHRQQVLTVMAFASVSTALPLQKGHIEGLATFSSKSDSYMRRLTEYEDACEPQSETDRSNGNCRHRAFPRLAVVCDPASDPRRPALSGGACVSAGRYSGYCCHVAWWQHGEPQVCSRVNSAARGCAV